MRSQWWPCLLALVWLPGILNGLADGEKNAVAKPRFMVAEWGRHGAGMVKQGQMAPAAFRRLFLDSYGMRGERYHAGKNAELAGVLVAWDETKIVTVPIRKWLMADGTSGWLCQASEDGTPPAFSVYATSEPALVSGMAKALGANR